ncbi:ABC transporter permease [Rothia sp. ND6WE1A]|uniref:ABC transporter permease n=1 Tax=Rothia sp. ND6WE1A TaxID=1848190 RepID=UPI0009F5F5A8|nr:ABC transporter permease [Rothia sp. ND6WE1A]
MSLLTSEQPEEAVSATPHQVKNRRTSTVPGWVWGAAGIIFAVALWWVFTHSARGNTMLTAFAPENIPSAFAALIGRGVLLSDIGVSLWRLLAGLAIAVLVGIPLGLLIGFSQAANQFSAPLVQFLRMVSPLSWAPIAVALFGVGSSPVIFLVAMAAIWPITLNTVSGVRALDQQHLQVAQTLGATPSEVLRTVVVPSIKPYVLAGIRLALGIAWVIIVPAEMLGVSSGLGYEILNARDRLAYDEMLAVILVIGALGMVLDWAAQKVLR